MKQKRDSFAFFVGYMLSFIGHMLAVVLAIFILEKSSAGAMQPVEIFSVTLEGGKNLGGISQVPSKDFKPPRVMPLASEPSGTPEDKKTQEALKESDKKLTEPSVVDDPAKLLAEQKKKEEEAKKKEAQERERKAAEEKKKKIEEDEKRAAEEKKKEELAKKEREKKFEEAIRRARQRSTYEGESANAGGEGFGAAKLGGSGMGGGTLESIEFIQYRNALEQHIKAGWHWIPGGPRLSAQVRVMIFPSGELLRQPEITASSGRDDFDASVVRAVNNAAPVPAPPAALVERFKEFTITFDSER